MSATVVLALLLVLLPGGALAALALGRVRGAAAWAGVLGSGWVLGAMAVALATHLPDTVPAHAFTATAPWLLGLLLLAAGAAWWRHRRRAGAALAPSPAIGVSRDPVWWLLLALLAAHLVLATLQAHALPTIPWDAWTTWLGRAKSWYGADAFAGFLTPAQWLVAAEPGARATLAPHYPEAISRLAVWIASAAGRWDTGAVQLPWPLLGTALALGLYGHLRRAGVMPRPAMVASFACLSLPLLNAHMTLAGYADLWLATSVAFALLHWINWRRARVGGDLVLAVVFALLLPLIKLEGAVWLACLLAAALWSLLPARGQWWIPAAAVAAVAIALAFGGVAVPLPGLGLVRLAWGEVSIPAIGTLALYWRPVGREVLESLLALGNWHLLWLVVPAVFALRWRVLHADAALRGAAAFLVLGYLFLFVLFFFTDAAAWAENLTSVNRVLLHVVPATIAVLALMCSQAVPADASAQASSR